MIPEPYKEIARQARILEEAIRPYREAALQFPESETLKLARQIAMQQEQEALLIKSAIEQTNVFGNLSENLKLAAEANGTLVNSFKIMAAEEAALRIALKVTCPRVGNQ